MKYTVIISVMIIGYSWTTAAIFPSIQNSEHVKKDVAAPTHGNDDDDKPDPPRNFTLEQLLQYDGAKDEKSNEDKPVYLSLNGIVFDVTKGRDFYGPGGPYEKVCRITFLLPLSMLASFVASLPQSLDSLKMYRCSLQVTNVVSPWVKCHLIPNF